MDFWVALIVEFCGMRRRDFRLNIFFAFGIIFMRFLFSFLFLVRGI